MKHPVHEITLNRLYRYVGTRSALLIKERK